MFDNCVHEVKIFVMKIRCVVMAVLVCNLLPSGPQNTPGENSFDNERASGRTNCGIA